MTEKQYGGATGRGTGEMSVKAKPISAENSLSLKKKAKEISKKKKSPDTDKEKIILAGEIASQVKVFAKTIIKPGVPLLEIAEKIESMIIELGGKPAFPINLSIDNIAAHYTPSHDDQTIAEGLLKVDFGVHIDGWAADNAFSIDLSNSEENKELIQATEEALENAIKMLKKNIMTSEIGGTIQKTIESYDVEPVMNLTGHSMDQYELHGGIAIPNIDDNRSIELGVGLYAIEPFATTGSGRVKDGKPSGIYELVDNKNIRSPIAREILEFIEDEYETLPFCSRWLIKKFGTKALFGLKQLEENGNINQFSQLVESKGSKVSQSEKTILIEENGNIIVTTL